jgi:hypothetical protein
VGSKAGARILLVVGFLAAWIGYDAWIASHVVFDPGTTRAAAHALLDAPTVRRGLADQVSQRLNRQLPGAANNPRVAQAIATALRDPRVVRAFADTVAQIHAAILAGTTQQNFVINGRAVTNAVHDALVAKDPKLAAQVAQLPPLAINIKHDKLPELHDPRSTSDAVAVLGIVAALLLITASLILQHDRRSFSRVGRRIAYLAVTPLLVFVVLPRIVEHASGDAPQIAAALLRVYGDRILPSAIGLVIVGLTIALGALVWPRIDLGTNPPDSGPGPYNGPTPSPRPGTGTDDPAITQRLYL